jgi:DNA-binding GntR family transcriptional regulator
MAGEAILRALPALSGAQRLVDAVQGALREAIISGTLRAGAQLSVPELARRLNVSRSPVREAVLGLVAQGLAVEQPRRGVVVATIAAEDLFAIHEMREFLEAGAARLAAQRIDKAGIARLKQILAEQKRAVGARDAEGYFRTNAELHRAIALGAGNQRLDAALLVLENQMRIALHRVAGDARHMQAGYDEHAAVVEAIAAGNADAAEQAMRRHIANTITRSRRAQAPAG